MKRTLSIVLAAGAASLLSPAPSPSWAQGPGAVNEEAEAVRARLKLIGELEEGLRFAEAARLRGECSSVEYARSRFYGFHMTILPPEVAADFQRRMNEISDRPCPPLAATPEAGSPSAAPPPPPRKPEEVHVPPPPVSEPATPVGSTGGPGPQPARPAPGGNGGAPEPPPPDGFEPILDELGEDVGATSTGLPPRPVQPTGDAPKTAPPPPPPRKPEEVHVPPKPTASSTGPLLPGRGDILDGMAPLRAELDAAISNCDPVAFKAAKNRLLEAIGQLLTRFPGNIHLLAERRRIEETQLPRPCPPE
jgi:hypothetical protein